MPANSSPVRSRLTRRGLGRSALGLAIAGSVAPAIAQGRRDLRVGLFGGDFGNLSPVIRYDIQGGLVVYNVFDGLVEIDYAKRTIEPLMAESWANPDPLTWRIKLREGVKWHKGFGELTAEDLVYTWNFHLESKSFQVGTALFPIDSVKADGKHVVEVKLKQPFGAFPGVTMGYGGLIICAKAHREMGNQAYSPSPIGNGPFFIEAVRGSEITLAKHPEYWRAGQPKLDRIVYRAIPDSTVRLQALLRGEFDFITHPDPKDVGEVKRNANFAYTSIAGWNWDYQQFNFTVRPELPFHNKLVRQAISYAIDREAIAKEIYFGEATITDNQIPPGYMGHRASLQRYPKNGDLKKARELIAQAGVRGYEVEVMTSDKDWLRKQLELVAAMVSQIGINYKIKNLDIGSFNNLWFNRRFEQHLEDITLVAPDPDATSWWFLHSKGSVSSFRNPQMDALLDGARSESDQKKREAMYHGIVDLTLEECPTIYHLNANYIQVYNRRLAGYSATPQEYIQLHHNTHWT
jgi:peptide/nickel transport system substrate-binding protein